MNDQSHNPFPAVVEGQIGDTTVQTVNARDLHRSLDVGKDFSNWIKDRIAGFGFSEHADFEIFEDLSSPNLASSNSRAQRTKEYALTIDMAKELAMVERNEAGKRVRQYFIECERKLKSASPLAEMVALSALNDPAAMRNILLTYTEKVIALQAENAVLGPKADAHDRIAESFGSTCRRIAAKNLGIPPLVLNRWMRTNGWTYQIYGTKDDIAYQSKISAGYLEHKVETGEKPDGTTWTRTSVRVTPKGMLALAKAFPPAVAEVPNTSRRGMVAGIAALAATAIAGLLPAPAKAEPLREGMAIAMLGGRSVTIDMTRYQPGPDESVVVAHFNGGLKIEPVSFSDLAHWYGRRSASTEPREPKPGDIAGQSKTRDRVWIVGTVVSAA